MPATRNSLADVSQGSLHAALVGLHSNDWGIVADATLVRYPQLPAIADANGGGRIDLWSLHSVGLCDQQCSSSGRTRTASAETSRSPGGSTGYRKLPPGYLKRWPSYEIARNCGKDQQRDFPRWTYTVF